mgnify:CR=1 FL=1
MIDDILPDYTRISSISGAFSGYNNVPRAILNNAASRGTQIHSIIKDLILDIPVEEERYLYNNVRMSGEIEQIYLKGYIDSFWKYWKTIETCGPTFPERMYEDILRTTGEVDLIAEYKGDRLLIDWKCTASKSESWAIQGNGYSILYEDNYCSVIDKILFVRLDKEGRDPEIVEIQHDVDLFHSAYEFYHRFFKNQRCNLEME